MEGGKGCIICFRSDLAPDRQTYIALFSINRVAGPCDETVPVKYGTKVVFGSWILATISTCAGTAIINRGCVPIHPYTRIFHIMDQGLK